MDRQGPYNRLLQLDGRIREGYARLDRQLDLINRLEAADLPSASARSLLRIFAALQRHYLRERDRLAEVLAEADARLAFRVSAIIANATATTKA